MAILTRNFFDRDTLIVARDLLGKKLVRSFDGQILSGMIVETEAYVGAEDTACHASKGKTPRNSIMFGMPGIAYIYFVYGMHYMLNAVTEAEGNPCAVLIRAVMPLEGRDVMEIHRKRSGKNLTDGPAKVCQAMGIDKSLNGWDLTLGKSLWIEEYQTIPSDRIHRTPRIGINYAAPKDRDALRRFRIEYEENPAVGNISKI
jgi:DNA-3-methyladenine glycosylase